jgi:hypothetical protein
MVGKITRRFVIRALRNKEDETGGRVARMGEIRSAWRIFDEEVEGKR